MKRFLFASIITAALFCVGVVSAHSQANPDTASRPTLPDISLERLGGGSWKLSEHKNSVVLLNFWATWCEPCRTEIPYLQKIADKHAKAGLVVFGINLDDGETAVVDKFIEEYKMQFPVLIPPADSPFRQLSELPTTLLIDREGRLVKRYTGAVPEAELEKDVAEIVREPKKD